MFLRLVAPSNIPKEMVKYFGMVKQPMPLTQQEKVEHQREATRKWRQNNPEKVKDYRASHRTLFLRATQKYNTNNREKYLKGKQEHHQRLKIEVLGHYSKNERIICECCGEQHLEFLSLNHLKGGGNKQRKQIGPHLYVWIKKHNYPVGFNVLCMNCNWAEHRGGCPHKKVKQHVM
jgi:hypothetical protein